ncbi:MAG: hypothetical protein AABX51_04460 [Nanoarchaeota archaeon]
MDKKYVFLIVLSIIVLIAFFFPKPFVKGGLGGFIPLGEKVYREEYKCFGFSHSFVPTNCADCGTINNCYGIPYGKKCYIESYESGEKRIIRTLEPAQCK